MHVGGNIDVEALASDLGGGNAVAGAGVFIGASGGEGGPASITIGSLTD